MTLQDQTQKRPVLSAEALDRIVNRRQRAARKAQGAIAPATPFPSAQFPEFNCYTDQELRIMALDGDKSALDAFFDRHWKLIDSIARKIHFVLPVPQQLTVSLDDIKQIVILDALKKMGNKPDHSAVSIAFGFNHFDGLKEARHQANGVYIPEGTNTLITKMRNFLRGKTSSDVSLEQIAEYLGIPVYPEINALGLESEDKVSLIDVLRAIQFQNMDSIDAGLPTNDDIFLESLLDTIEDLISITSEVPHDVEELCAASLARQAVWDALPDLKESWRDLLIENFGIANGKPKRLERIAEERGVTAQNVSAMKSRALARLGEPNSYDENPLREALDYIDFR